MAGRVAPPPASTAAACRPAGPSVTGTTRTVPILMYHRVGDPPAGSRWPGLYVRTADFQAQLQALVAGGWRTITAAQLGQAMRTHQPVPARSFVISIDDGRIDSWTRAFPILQRDCLRATFYIPAGFIGQPSRMSLAELAAIARAGDELGNHSLTHIDLAGPGVTAAVLQRQIAVAGATLRSALASIGVSIRVTTFAYPSGRFSAACEALLARLSYTLAVTTAYGPVTIGATPPLLAPRIRVSRGETASQLLAAIR